MFCGISFSSVPVGTPLVLVFVGLYHHSLPCGCRRVARQFHANNGSAYLYQFSMPRENRPAYRILGNFHSSELSLVFGNDPLRTFSVNETTLSASFQSYWTSMPKHGHPNGNLSTAQALWLPYVVRGLERCMPNDLLGCRYNDTGRSYMTMDVPTTLNSNLNGPNCDFWDHHTAKYYNE